MSEEKEHERRYSLDSAPMTATSRIRLMAATQKPISESTFGASVDQAAWKAIPSWYLVTREDRAIHPKLERFYAKRMGARTTGSPEANRIPLPPKAELGW